MTPLIQFVIAFSAAVCAAAAVGVFATARETLKQIEQNSQRAQRAEQRSVGNRRHVSWLSRKLLSADEHRKPREFEPHPRGTDE